MRGQRRYAEKMPPRRRWQAVIAPHNDLTRNAIYATLRRMRQPRTPPGCDLGAAHRRSPHVATTPRGEIRGYARLPPPAGVAEMSAFGHRLCRWQRGGLCAAPDHSATGVYLWHTLYMYRVIPAQLRKCRAMIRSTRFGVLSSVAARCANRQPPPLLFTLIHSSSHPLIHSKLRFYFDFPLVCTIFR